MLLSNALQNFISNLTSTGSIIRFQDIAGGLDSVLTATITPAGMHDNQAKPQTLLLKQSVKLLESLQACWSDDVLVFSHSDKFLRLSLQLISRYSYCRGFFALSFMI
jgi:hypothetical protein